MGPQKGLVGTACISASPFFREQEVVEELSGEKM